MVQIKMFISDVYGTLTDHGIYYDDSGNELKKFSTMDTIDFTLFMLLEWRA